MPNSLMKYIFQALLPLSSLLLIISCTEKDRFTTNDASPALTIEEAIQSIRINEFVGKGSTLVNEFNEAADWFELYNPTDLALTLKAYRWHFSDNQDQPIKFTLSKDVVLEAKSHLVVWCDGHDEVTDEIHTNFKLSADGDHILISYQNQEGLVRIIDEYSYGELMHDNYSYGRMPDGTENWVIFAEPTPNATNREY